MCWTYSMQNTESDLLNVCVKNISAEGGLIKYEGMWETELHVGQTPKGTALARETNPVKVKIQAAKTEYTVQQAVFDRNALFLECDAEEYTPFPQSCFRLIGKGGKSSLLHTATGKRT